MNRSEFLEEFNRIKENRNKGLSPVFSETRMAKTNLRESIPYNAINGLFLIAGTYILNRLYINELLSIAVVLILNNFCGALSNFIFSYAKHYLRYRFLKKMDLDFTEENIAILESMEYQTI